MANASKLGCTGLRSAIAIVVLLLCAPVSLGQFGTPGSTNTRERLAGRLTDGGAGEAPSIAEGDQIGVFFEGMLVGLFQFSAASAASGEFSVIIFGDDPSTQITEGPSRGDRVEFRYFDESTEGVLTGLSVRNLQGEILNYRYAGENIPPLPIQLPGLDLVPTREVNLSFSGSSSNPDTGGGDGGGGGGTPTGNPDVDGDGSITTRDAALVLRIVSGGPSTAAVRGRADVNGDGAITVADAVAVLRSR